MSGNQAMAMGALAAGCRVYAGYPITPATDIMEFLAAELPKVGGSVVQAEDEMAAIGMVLGASYAGKKSMTATSGPGISLMTEMLGLACMAEIPSVVMDAQRAGPSTGMPTRQEQGDLYLAAFGGHGEMQRIVLAPVSVDGLLHPAINAFNLSEEFQMPAILMGDTTLGVRTESIPPPNLSTVRDRQPTRGSTGTAPTARLAKRDRAGHRERYKRYHLTDGISPMAIPGAGGRRVRGDRPGAQRVGPAALGRQQPSRR